jgi:hypothetical protein
MVRHLRRNLIAYLALFVALGGTSYAALKLPKNSVGEKQIKKNAVTNPKIKNGAVTASKIGRNAVSGSNVKDGSLTKSDLKNGEIPNAFDGTLPSGRSLRGTWAASGTGSTVVGAVSFGVALKSAPAPHFISDGVAPTSSCPGSAAAPAAAAGQLCVYEEAGSQNVGSVTLRAPGSVNDPSAAPFGTLAAIDNSVADGPVRISGSWAVTAP